MTESSPLDPIAQEFVERLRGGHRAPIEQFVERFPELASEIRELFPVLEIMERSAAQLESSLGAPRASEAGPLSTLSLRVSLAISALPDDERQVVKRFRRGESLGEIAAALSRTSAEVAGLLRRGLRQLRAAERREGLG